MRSTPVKQCQRTLARREMRFSVENPLVLLMVLLLALVRWRWVGSINGCGWSL
jgi:hypothetical protein